MSEAPKIIVVATTNERKVQEITSEIGNQTGYIFMSLAQIGSQYGVSFIEPEEVGRTFLDTAGSKAESYLRQLQAHNIPVAGVLAEDSGFQMPALTDYYESRQLPEPLGLHTKRFYGDAKEREKTEKILKEVKLASEAGFSESKGVFICAIVLRLLAGEAVEVHETYGELPVRIIENPVWNPNDPKNIFALDPIAVPIDQRPPAITLSEYRQLNPQERDRTGIVTHRTLAISQIKRALRLE